MRKYFILFFIIIAFIEVFGQDNYSRGFTSGYKEGYCYNDYGCSSPVPPTPPSLNIGESRDSYQDGYNKGFKMGLEDKQVEVRIDSNKIQEYTPNAGVIEIDIPESPLYKQALPDLRQLSNQIYIQQNASNNITEKGSANNSNLILLKTQIDTISYFLGTQIGTDLYNNGAISLKIDFLKLGIEHGLKENFYNIDFQNASQLTQNYFSTLKQIKAPDEVKKFVEEYKKKQGVKVTSSGLMYEVIKDTQGKKPSATDNVSVYYTGKLINGKIFDSSLSGEPVTFPLNQVIKGWTEGLQLMSIGSKFKFVIPSTLAYGEQGVLQAGIGSNETLIFEVELLNIKK
jgi:FKBP-type peptidyl-prolyl cis-trans isomerase